MPSTDLVYLELELWDIASIWSRVKKNVNCPSNFGRNWKFERVGCPEKKMKSWMDSCLLAFSTVKGLIAEPFVSGPLRARTN